MFGGLYFFEWGFLDICEALLIIMSIWDQRKMGGLDLNSSNEISAESKSLWLMEEHKEVEGRKESSKAKIVTATSKYCSNAETYRAN